MTLAYLRLACAFSLVLLAKAAAGQEVDGAGVFEQTCAGCHGARSSMDRAPKLEALRLQQPRFVVDTLTAGVMRAQAQRLNPSEIRAVAEYVTGKKLSADSADPAAGRCTNPKPMSGSAQQAAWPSWGRDLSNTRFQTAEMAQMTAADLPKLKLKWAIGLPDTSHAWSQPTVAGGRVFVGSQGGHIYALDAQTGCVIWSFLATGASRTAVVIGDWPGRPNSTLAYFTTIPGWLYALDAQTGALVWRVRVEDHVSTRMTGSPVLFQGKLYVSAASFEEGMSTSKDYECCSFHGSLSAFDAATGQRFWKREMIDHPAAVLKTSATGKKLIGPAGGSIWSAPVIDPRRNLLYVTTGNGFSGPAQPLTDAIVALDPESGQIRWSRQVSNQDIFVPGCGKPGNTNFSCPEENGPDADFGSAPILAHLANGGDLILAGQKSGTLWAVDPDHAGRVVWQYKAAPGAAGEFGALVWGQAIDKNNVYIPVSNIQDPAHAGGLHAVSLATGKRVWYAAPGPVMCGSAPGCTRAQASPPSVIPGVVFAGSADGGMRAYSTADGKVIWSVDTNRNFETVNGVKANGGSMIAAGPAIASGWIYFNSGYGSHGGHAGNVLLAFSTH
jgi:polyvinyl alcohol dehydrogenase (cytochrome)